jgi:digeranylgeranylglycerophospholipid reductase
MKCDVLVVGAGPAGCSAAMAAAKKTIVIEEHVEVGIPVQCAEGIGTYLFPFLPFEIPEDQLIWKIEGMYLWADGIAVTQAGDKFTGYSVNRGNWDKFLASMAVENGTEILTGTKMTSFDREGGEVKKVTVERAGEKVEIEPRYVIGADGSHSTVIDCLGVGNDNALGYCKNYEMRNLNLKYPRYDQFYSLNEIKHAIAYIFPLSETSANVGAGHPDSELVDEIYECFINIPHVHKQLTDAKIVIEKSGDAPIRNPSDKWVYGNVFLVGDAANQNIKPYIEGNLAGVICGTMLGNFIDKVSRGEEDPGRYEALINRDFPLIKESQGYARVFYEEWGIENNFHNLIILGLLSDIILPEKEEIQSFIEKGYDSLRDYLLKNGGFIEE